MVGRLVWAYSHCRFRYGSSPKRGHRSSQENVKRVSIRKARKTAQNATRRCPPEKGRFLVQTPVPRILENLGIAGGGPK